MDEKIERVTNKVFANDDSPLFWTVTGREDVVA